MVGTDANTIISRLPYTKPFLFVDELLEVTEDGVKGTYTYSPEDYFYKGHFKDHPVTPGVILTETMAQIGLVCLGISLMGSEAKGCTIAMTSAEAEFLKPVYPGERVTVVSKKIYFRFGKLKCRVALINDSGEEACRATLAGMVTNKQHG